MLTVIRKTIPFRRARRRRTPFPYGSLSNHMLRDLGFESRQVEEILTYIAGASNTGRRPRGSDAELSYCVRAAANSNEPDLDDEPTHRVRRPERTRVAAATEIGRPVLAPVNRDHDRARAVVRTDARSTELQVAQPGEIRCRTPA